MQSRVSETLVVETMPASSELQLQPGPLSLGHRTRQRPRRRFDSNPPDPCRLFAWTHRRATRLVPPRRRPRSAAGADRCLVVRRQGWTRQV